MRVLPTRVAQHRPRGVSFRRWVPAAALLAWGGVVLAAYYLPPVWRFGFEELSLGVDMGWPQTHLVVAAALHALTALAGASLCMLAAIVAGGWICRRLRVRFTSRAEFLVVTSSIGIGALAYLGLGLAIGEIYTTTMLRTVVGVVLVLGAVHWWRTNPHSPSQPRVCGHRRDRVWQFVIVVMAVVSIIGALAPEIEYDATWFHLTYPQRFLAEGRLVDLPHDYVSLYPLTWELWFGFGMSAGGLGAAKLLHWACLPLTAAAIAVTVRRFVPGASPWAASAIFMATPTITWEATTAYIDLALALHVTVAIYALLRFIDERAWPWLFVAGLSLGTAAGTKHLTLIAITVACPWLLVMLWRRTRRMSAAIGPPVALGLMALAVAAPWYLRSYLASGNPVFPEFYGVFGAPPDRWDATLSGGLASFLSAFGRPRTFWNQLSLPWDISLHGGRYGGLIGPLFLALIPMLAFRRRWGSLGSIGGFVAAYLALWASPLSSFQMRFIVPVASCLAILASAGLATCEGRLRVAVGRGIVPTTVIVAGLLLLQLPAFMVWHNRDRVGWDRWVTHAIFEVPMAVVVGARDRDEYLAQRIRSFPTWRAANVQVPPDARVLDWSQGSWLYARRDALWIYSVQARPLLRLPPGRESEVRDVLGEKQLTHVIVERKVWESEASQPTMAMFTSSVRDELYDVLFEDVNYLLLSIRPNEPLGTHLPVSSAN